VGKSGCETGFNWLWLDRVEHNNEHFNSIKYGEIPEKFDSTFWSFLITVWEGYDFNTNEE
jgi:hypothetical protein